jgi:hypothetical protein
VIRLSPALAFVLAPAVVLSAVACNEVLGNEPIVYADDASLDGPPNGGVDAGGRDAPVVVLPDASCAGSEACERVVFVTSTVSQGGMGGLAGADRLCQQQADVEGSVVRGRKFVAWLSDSIVWARERNVHGTQPYKRTDGRMIAFGWDQLVSGNLIDAIDHDERGQLRAPLPVAVWTGTAASGTRSVPNCSEWETSSPEQAGTTGLAPSTDERWTRDDGQHLCSTPAALYCIER